LHRNCIFYITKSLKKSYIFRGGVALCLSQDGRRNGEAIVKFETRSHREFALQRHRQFLHNRYIEVYRATGDDFLKVAVGSDLEAIKFASRKSAMIVRCRGLPFDCTKAQIEEFFASDGEGHGIIEDGILFVFRPDGRPSGDAFVLFADDEAGKRALSKHKNRIGQRYIELFRTTQAEVQQVFNRSRASPQAMLQHLVPTVFGQKRDCIRLRGLPYEATINDIADFMGPHSRHITLHGIHMVFNNHGNPSGECFIQMDSEASAASAAHSMHNKYMEIGKKKRYIEVFQWSTDEIPAILNAAAGQQQLSPTTPSTMSCSSGSSGIFPAGLLPQIPLQAFRAAAPTQMGLIPGQNFGATPFFHPSHALTPDQLIYASTQLAQFPFYSPEQLQLAAHQLEAATSAQALYQAQLNAAQFHHHHSILSNPTAINVSAATAAVSQIPQHDYVVPISAPPLTLIHT
jgi:epithelial splicing regulatory protein 1/2